MNSTHKHIINKVFVDVNTNSKKTAFAIKDNIDGFLKEDIFPYMENYFKTLEKELPAEIIQIPKLKLEVTGDSRNNFEALKENIKKQIKEEVKKIVGNPSKAPNKAVFLSINKSKQETFIFFLEYGTMPWWNTKETPTEYNKEAIIKLFKTNSFKTLFKRKIENPSVKNRIINQFSSIQIVTILSEVFKNEIITILKRDKIINTLINQLKPKYKQWFWEQVIQYCIEENKENIVSKFIMVLESKPVKENNEIVELTTLILKAIPEKTLNELTAKNPFSIENYKAKESEKKQISNSIQKILGNSESVEEENDLKASKTETEKVKKEPKDVLENTTENKKEDRKRSKNILKQKTKNTNKAKGINEINKSKEEAYTNESLSEKNALDEKNKEQKSQKDKDAVEHTAETINETLENTIKKEIAVKKQEKEIKTSITNANREEGESRKTLNKEDDLKPRHEEKKHLKNQVNVEGNTEEKKRKADNTLKKAYANKISQESLTLKQKEIFDLTKKRAYIPEFKKENKGEYYVKNAGLIILHPYLKNFFTTCKLLNEANEIINQELAIHLLHYLATKKEQQYENNMVFEKFLCGIAIEQSIRREVVIPEDLKEKAEDLLTAVVEHWKALNNASTSLLRNEFLQRSGKISFKNKNPKIIVERKVFDLLLNKLPWTLSLSKLPWIDKLIYTDW